MARYLEALAGYRGGRLSCVEAAGIGISEWHFRCATSLRRRGLIDRRCYTRAQGEARSRSCSIKGCIHLKISRLDREGP